MSSDLLSRSASAATRHPHSSVSSRDNASTQFLNKASTPTIERQDFFRKNFNMRLGGLDFGRKSTISIATTSSNIKARGFRLNITVEATAGTLAQGWGVRLMDRVQVTAGGTALCQYRYLPAFKTLVDRAPDYMRDAVRDQCGSAHDFAVNPTATCSVPLFFFDKWIQQKFGAPRDGRSVGIPLGIRSALKFEIHFNSAAFTGDALFAGSTPNIAELELEYTALTAIPGVNFCKNWRHFGHYCFTEEQDDARFNIAAAETKPIRITDIEGPVEYVTYELVSQADLTEGANVLPRTLEMQTFDLKINANSIFDTFSDRQRIHAWQQDISDYHGTAASPRATIAPLGRGSYVDDLAHMNEHGTLVSASDELLARISAVDTTVATTCLSTTIKQCVYAVTPTGEISLIFEY